MNDRRIACLPPYRKHERDKAIREATLKSADFFCYLLIDLEKLQGGSGFSKCAKPQIVISDSMVQLSTRLKSWPVMKTIDIKMTKEWAEEMVKAHPDKFDPEVLIQSRLFSSGDRGLSQIGNVYFIGSHEMEYVKIGVTDNLEMRLDGLQTSSPFELHIIYTFRGNIEEERKTHERFKVYRKHGEWFYNEGELREYLDYVKIPGDKVKPWQFKGEPA